MTAELPEILPDQCAELSPEECADAPCNSSSGSPDHLLVLVHGILASSSEWRHVERELKERLGHNVLVYCSTSNFHFLTLQGVDRAGQRLAAEVRDVVARTPKLRRISFLGHSLGGLIARYAVGLLYESEGQGRKQLLNDRPQPTTCASKNSGVASRSAGGLGAGDICAEAETRGGGGTMAGLTPMNFITLATPNLGVRGNKQLPFLLGVPVLEAFAPPLAPIFIGRTGRQLFLTDGSGQQPPLLQRMATDCAEAPFISALGAFHLRVAYANAGLDHMVGWRTASIRREGELPRPPKVAFTPRHEILVNVEDSPAVPLPELAASHQEVVAAAAARLGWGSLRGGGASASSGDLKGVSAWVALSSGRLRERRARSFSGTGRGWPRRTERGHRLRSLAAAHDTLEEEMIRGLQQVEWRRVDVSLREIFRPGYAHNHIHNWAARTMEEAANMAVQFGANLEAKGKHPRPVEKQETTPVSVPVQ